MFKILILRWEENFLFSLITLEEKHKTSHLKPLEQLKTGRKNDILLSLVSYNMPYKCFNDMSSWDTRSHIHIWVLLAFIRREHGSKETLPGQTVLSVLDRVLHTAGLNLNPGQRDVVCDKSMNSSINLYCVCNLHVQASSFTSPTTPL